MASTLHLTLRGLRLSASSTSSSSTTYLQTRLFSSTRTLLAYKGPRPSKTLQPRQRKLLTKPHERGLPADLPSYLHDAWRRANKTGRRLLREHADVPAYPYGRTYVYNQANWGLYGGQRKQFGNNVSRKTETKTRRHWDVNVRRKRLFSVILGRHLPLRVSARVLRTIDKVGGLDEYLLGSSAPGRLKELGMAGWKLRAELMRHPETKRRFRREALALGLPAERVEALYGKEVEEAERQAGGQEAEGAEAQQQEDPRGAVVAELERLAISVEKAPLPGLMEVSGATGIPKGPEALKAPTLGI